MKHLFFKYQNKRQLVLATLGTFLGLLFLFTSLHFLHKIYAYGDNTEMLSKNTIVVQKKVTKSSVLGLANSEFSEKEISDFRKMSFVENCDVIRSSSFDVIFQIDDPLIPSFNSDIFVQSVQKEYLDVKTDKWSWKEGDEIVPIIMPRDFLMMLNNFLSISNIPQLSDDLVLELKINLKIRGRMRHEWVKAKIVGFTNELSSILVPESFVLWGNAAYGKPDEEVISQLVVKSKDGQFGNLEKYLDENNLESKKSQMVIARLKSALGVLLSLISVVSLLTVFLAMLVLVQYLQLILTHNEYEIRTLLRLGHAPRVLIRVFTKYFVKLFFIILLVSVGVFGMLKFYLEQLFISGGISLDSSISFFLYIAIILVFGIFTFSIWKSSKNKMDRTFNS